MSVKKIHKINMQNYLIPR